MEPLHDPPLHPDVAELGPLIGTWEGSGTGNYPTIDDFEYTETISFGHVHKPFVTYQQRTRAVDDGRPLHAESGFWRVPAPGRVELVLAHPTGITELEEGTISIEGDAITIELASTTIGRSASAKQVDVVERTFVIQGDTMEYTLRMSAVGHALQHHLTAQLHRT